MLHANGNIYDAEGFLISTGADFALKEQSTVLATASSLRAALRRMDSDITGDAVPHPQEGLNKALLRIVLSGCVATSLFLPEDLSSLYVIQVGDCGAVLGRYVGDDPQGISPASEVPPMPAGEAAPPETRPKKMKSSDWQADLLVQPHNAENLREVERLQSQHPIHEASLMIVENRLLCKLFLATSSRLLSPPPPLSLSLLL